MSKSVFINRKNFSRFDKTMREVYKDCPDCLKGYVQARPLLLKAVKKGQRIRLRTK